MDKNNWKPTKRYLKSFSELYGAKTAEQATKHAKRVAKNDSPLEEMEQAKLVKWLRENDIKFYAIPNGRKTAIEGMRYKQQGAVAGVPDICLPYMRKGFGALYVELKRQTGGVVSDAQKDFISFLNEQGYKAVVCLGFENAKNTVEEYLEI